MLDNIGMIETTPMAMIGMPVLLATGQAYSADSL